MGTSVSGGSSPVTVLPSDYRYSRGDEVLQASANRPERDEVLQPSSLRGYHWPARREVYRFRTWRDGRDRTEAVLAALAAGDPPIRAWTGPMAQALIESSPSVTPKAGVAHGKLAILQHGADGVIPAAAVFQSVGGRCGRVDCGNASAAVALAVGKAANASTVTFTLSGSSDTAPTIVNATIRCSQVQQTWKVAATPRVQVSTVCGRRTIEIVGLFNKYIVIDARFDDVAVMTLLGNADPLDRIATVDVGGSAPKAAFFTCGRPHPSAPLTGLGVLAFLGQEIPWLKLLATTRTLIVNGLPEPLPMLVVRPNAVEIDFPETGVELEWLAGLIFREERAA